MDTDKILDIAIIGAVALGGIYLLKQITGSNVAKDLGTAAGDTVGSAAGGTVTGFVKGTVDSGKDLANYFNFYSGWGTDLINKVTGNSGLPSTQTQRVVLADGTVISHDFPLGTDEPTIEKWFFANGVPNPNAPNTSPSNSNQISINNSGSNSSPHVLPVVTTYQTPTVSGVAKGSLWDNIANNTTGNTQVFSIASNNNGAVYSGANQNSSKAPVSPSTNYTAPNLYAASNSSIVIRNK